MCSLGYGQNYKIMCPFNLGGVITHRSVISESYLSFFVGDQDVALIYANQPLLNIKTALEVVQTGYNIKDKINFKNIQIAQDENYSTYESPVMHSWAEDVFARGSYSGYSVNLSAELDQKINYKNTQVKKVFEPIDDSLFFIGEHTTILECVGTMEAAVESGDRIAKLWV
jgi:monoamine oxidase